MTRRSSSSIPTTPKSVMSSPSSSSFFRGCGVFNGYYGCAFVLPPSSSTSSRIQQQQQRVSITNANRPPLTNTIINHDHFSNYIQQQQQQQQQHKFMLPPTLSSSSYSICSSSNRIYSSSPSSATQLYVLDPFTKSACISFFDSVKIPSTIVSGISLAALFTLSKESQDTSFMSRIKILIMRLYHLSSFLCFIMSLTSIMTAQTATTMLLFEGNNWIVESSVRIRKGFAMDAEAFFLECMIFEILLTRWSFIMSFLFLLCSTTLRLIVEFDLFTRRRKVETFMVISMMTSVFTSCLSCLNTTQQKSYKNLWYMTKEVVELFWERIYVKRYPLQIASGCCLILAILCSLTFLLPTTVNNEKLADHENYT